jgi:hypothetical protein
VFWLLLDLVNPLFMKIIELSLFALLSSFVSMHAAVFTVTLDPTASSAANSASFTAGFSSLSNGDTVVVQGTSPGTAQVVEMDFASVNLTGVSGITVQWDHDLTAKVPSGLTTLSRLLRFNYAPGITLTGLRLDGNSANTEQNLALYAFSTDALVCVLNSANALVTDFEIKNTAMMAVLINTGNGSVVSHGALDHYRSYGLMLRNCQDGSIEYNTVSNHYDQTWWQSHSLDLMECMNSRIYCNDVSDTYNAAIQTTDCTSSQIIGNICSNIQWNGYKSDGDAGINILSSNHWDNVGGYALFFGGSRGISEGSYTVEENVWTHLTNVIQPDGSELSWKFRTANGLAATATFAFNSNEVHDYVRVDSATPVLFSGFPGAYSVTNNTFDTMGPKNGITPPVFGRVFQNDPIGHESGNIYVNCVSF